MSKRNRNLIHKEFLSLSTSIEKQILTHKAYTPVIMD
jgi:hypothetical protein